MRRRGSGFLFLAVFPFFSVGLRAANPLFENLAPNTALDLGRYTCVDLDVDCARVVEYTGMVYDSDHNQILLFGGGHATTFRDDVDVFDLNVASPTWTPAYAPTPCAAMGDANLLDNGTWAATGHPASRHTYDALVYAPNVQRLLVLSGLAGAGGCSGLNLKQWQAGKMHHYDPTALQWTPSPNDAFDFGMSTEYDPVSGWVVALGPAGFWTYDPVGRSAVQRTVGFPSDIDYADNMIYFPPNQRMYYIERTTPTRVLAVSLNRTAWDSSSVSVVIPANTPPGTEETGWDYDASNQIIGGGVRDGVFYAFDPTTGIWSQTPMVIQSPTVGVSIGSVGSSVEGDAGRSTHSHALIYSPVDNVFVFLANGNDGLHTWAYRYAGGSPAPPLPAAPARPTGFRRR